MTGSIVLTPDAVTAAVPSAFPGYRPGTAAPDGPLRPSPGDGAAARPPCRRCGAAGTHYLTCPSLRLPPGYRLSQDAGPGHPYGPDTGIGAARAG